MRPWKAYVTTLRAADLANFLAEDPIEVLTLESDIDLLAIPGRRLTCLPIHESASLWDAWQALHNSQADALYLARMHNPFSPNILGVVTPQAVTDYYQLQT